MDLEKTKIYFGMTNWASRPQMKGGARFKRAHVLIKAKEFTTDNKQPKEVKK